MLVSKRRGIDEMGVPEAEEERKGRGYSQYSEGERKDFQVEEQKAPGRRSSLKEEQDGLKQIKHRGKGGTNQVFREERKQGGKKPERTNRKQLLGGGIVKRKDCSRKEGTGGGFHRDGVYRRYRQRRKKNLGASDQGRQKRGRSGIYLHSWEREGGGKMKKEKTRKRRNGCESRLTGRKIAEKLGVDRF